MAQNYSNIVTADTSLTFKGAAIRAEKRVKLLEAKIKEMEQNSGFMSGVETSQDLIPEQSFIVTEAEVEVGSDIPWCKMRSVDAVPSDIDSIWGLVTHHDGSVNLSGSTLEFSEPVIHTVDGGWYSESIPGINRFDILKGEANWEAELLLTNVTDLPAIGDVFTVQLTVNLGSISDELFDSITEENTESFLSFAIVAPAQTVTTDDEGVAELKYYADAAADWGNYSVVKYSVNGVEAQYDNDNEAFIIVLDDDSQIRVYFYVDDDDKNHFIIDAAALDGEPLIDYECNVSVVLGVGEPRDTLIDPSAGQEE